MYRRRVDCTRVVYLLLGHFICKIFLILGIFFNVQWPKPLFFSEMSFNYIMFFV
jgi:hypothetical protein